MMVELLFLLLALLSPVQDDAQRERELSAQAERELSAGRHGEAIRALRELEALYTQLGDPLAASATLGRIGECYLADSCLPEAVGVFRTRLERLRQLLGDADHAEFARALNGLGVALLRDGRSSEALPLFEDALAMRQRLDHADSDEVATALSNVGFCLSAQGRGQQALPRFEEAWAMTARLHGEESPEVALALGNLGAALQSLGRNSEALPHFERAYALLERARPEYDLDRARALGGLASCLDANGRSSEALPLHRDVLELRRRLHAGDHPELVASLNNLAGCLDSLDRDAEALPLFQEALATARRLYDGDHFEIAVGLNNVGACLQKLGRISEALHLLESALAAWRRMEPGDHPELAFSLEGLATCFVDLGESEEALPLYEEALAMRRRLFRGDHPELATSTARLARCLRDLGRPEEALPLFEAALAMRQRLAPGDSRAVAQSLNDFASCLDALGAGEQALSVHEAALAMWQRLYAEDPRGAIGALVGAASCLRCLGRGSEALATYGQALAVVRRTGSEGLHQFAADLARLLVDDLGRPAEAIPVLEEAIGEIEHLRAEERGGNGLGPGGSARLVGRGGAFEAMVRAQVAVGRDAEALGYVERARVLGLFELLAGPSADALEELEELGLERGDAELVAEVRALRGELEASDADLAELSRAQREALARGATLEHERIERELAIARACRRDALRRRAAVVARGLAWSTALEPAAFQALLEPDEYALVYALSDVVGFVFVVPPTGGAIRSHALVWPDGEPVRREELERRIDEYLRSLGMSAMLAAAFGETQRRETDRREPERARARRYADLGHELFQALVPPEVWDELRGARAVRVVPDGALRRLPLEVLVVEPARTLARSSYWLDRGPPLSYVPSASVLAWCRARRLSAASFKAPRPDDELLHEEALRFDLAAASLHAGAPSVVVRLWQAGDAGEEEAREPFSAAVTLAQLSAARRAYKEAHPEPLHWAAFVAVGDPR